MWRRAVAERVAAALALLALSFVEFEGRVAGDLALPLLTVVSLSLILPGLGVAALALLVPLSGGSTPPLTLLLSIPVAALAARFWPQAYAWVAAAGREKPVISQIALAALLFSLRFASPSAAAALMFFYTLAESFKLSLSTPAGVAGCSRLIVAQGLPRTDSSDWTSIVGDWFLTNLVGPPRLLLLASTYAAAGAASAKLQKLDAAWLANVVPPIVTLLAFYAVARSVGLQPDTESVLVVAMSMAMALTSELRRLKPVLRRRAKEAVTAKPPPTIPPHLVNAWRALCEMLASGERLLVVFGPSGCGKTLVVREAARSCKLKLVDPRNPKGGVVLLERADSVENVGELVRRSLSSEARCVVLETSHPVRLMERLRGIPLRRAVYVMPPDEETRSRVIARALAKHADEGLVSELARASHRYSLRSLARLAGELEARARSGKELRQAVFEALQEVQPDLSLEELTECENFILTFRGIVAGFSPSYALSLEMVAPSEVSTVKVEKTPRRAVGHLLKNRPAEG